MAHITEDKWDQIFTKRLITVVLWNTCLQVTVAVILVFIIQVNFLHPITWVTSTFQDIFSLKMTLNITLLVLVSVFQAIIYGRYHLVPPPKYFTRISLFLNMFTIQNMIFCLLHALSGYFTMSLYSSLAKSNFYVLKKKCQNYDGQCLLEDSLFLQFGGMWIGLYYFVTRHIFGTTMLIFPHIHQGKYHKIKLALDNIITMGLQNAIVPCLYYCIFYLIWGNKPRSLVSDVYSLYLEDAPLDSLINLVKSGIWLKLWFYTSLFFMSVYIMRNAFNIALTDPINFPIESDTKVTLHMAIGQKGQFNAILGAQDLRMLSMTDPKRRLEIFTLSQPGGHPRNWDNILTKCLSVINDFCNELETINGDTKADVNISPSKKYRVTDTMPPMGYIRNLADSPQLHEFKYDSKSAQGTVTDILKAELVQIFHKLCQKPGLSYFFGELMDTKLKFLLIQAQPLMWTCEGLSHLAAVSLEEDQYGIVQNDLPVIISTLINLKQSLEKISKLGLVSRKQILNDSLAIKMKSALMSSVKRSIYKIIITFSKYINDIPLHPDVQIAIQPFLLCKEA